MSRCPFQGILDELGAADEFDSVVVSADIGMIKPQPGIYKRALQDLGVEAEEAVFIDDAGVNVDGAKAVGMQAILYENLAQLRQDLDKIL